MMMGFRVCLLPTGRADLPPPGGSWCCSCCSCCCLLQVMLWLLPCCKVAVADACCKWLSGLSGIQKDVAGDLCAERCALALCVLVGCVCVCASAVSCLDVAVGWDCLHTTGCCVTSLQAPACFLVLSQADRTRIWLRDASGFLAEKFLTESSSIWHRGCVCLLGLFNHYSDLACAAAVLPTGCQHVHRTHQCVLLGL